MQLREPFGGLPDTFWHLLMSDSHTYKRMQSLGLALILDVALVLYSRGGRWTTTNEDLESERIDFDGLQVTVVTPETLYRMKKATVRLRDKGDAERIRQRFGLEED